MKRGVVQTAMQLVYPSRCTLCGDLVEGDHALCAPCWGKTPLVAGHVCDGCGVPLPGEGDETDRCDECMHAPHPWARGRTAMRYDGNGRTLVLALKHGDRQEVLRPAARWLAQAAGPLLTPTTLIAPVPLHWTRLLRRTYNQAALLSGALAHQTGHAHCADLLLRTRATRNLNGLTRAERAEQLHSAITLNPRRRIRIAGRAVLLVDDVMTSGATLAAASRACLEGGAALVNIVTLARAVRDA